MATQTTVTLTDDLDQAEADDITTVTFGLDHELFEIDLKPENLDKLIAALAPYLDHGRPIRKTARLCGANRRNGGKIRMGKPASTVARARASRPDFAEIRAWAAAEGFNERGRLADSIIEKYDKRKIPRLDGSGPGCAGIS